MKILVTGATGNVGSVVLKRLTDSADSTVTGVSRQGNEHGVVAWRMGSEPCPDILREASWDVVVHTAADVRWNLSVEDARSANVATAEALRQLLGDRTNVIHVSTAFVTGLRGSIDSTDPADYRNSYEWSKAAAERVLDQHGPNWAIRPPMIIGSRTDGGRIGRFHGVYPVVEAYLWATLPVIVAYDEGPIELVGVDDVADQVVARALAGPPSKKTVSTLGRGELAMTTQQTIDVIFDELNAWRHARGVEPLAVPPLIPPRRWERFMRPFAEQHLSRSQLALMHAFDVYLPYWAMQDHVHPDVIVGDTEPVLRHSIQYWADRHPRTAASVPKHWKAAG